jgi:hypothetical protein
LVEDRYIRKAGRGRSKCINAPTVEWRNEAEKREELEDKRARRGELG